MGASRNAQNHVHYKNYRAEFEVFYSMEQRYATESPRKSFAKDDGVVAPWDAGDGAAALVTAQHRVSANETLPNLAFPIFSARFSLI